MADPFAAYGGATLTPDNTVVTGNTDLPNSAGAGDPLAAYGGAKLSPPPMPGTGMNRSGQIDFGSGGLQPAPTLSDRIAGRDPAGDIMEVAGSHLKNAVVGPYRAVTAPPQGTAENIANIAMPGGLAAYRTFVKPSVDAAGEAISDVKQGKYSAAADAALTAVPVVGPWTKQIDDDAEQHGLLAAAAGVGTDLLAAKGVNSALGAAGRFTQNRTPLPGENYTPIQHQALSGVLARGTGMGKDFIAPDVAHDIASPLRQAAANSPAKVQAIMRSPQDALGATQSLLKDAQTTIDTQHQMALQPVANTPVDMTPVQNAIPNAKSFHDDSERAAIQDLKDRAAKVKTLGDLNDFRQYLGQENSSTFRQNPVAANSGSVRAAALKAADSAARDYYYDQLERNTGLDFQPIKRTESSILKAQEALGNVAPSLVNKHILANEDKGLLSNAADLIEGGTKASHGLPVVGYLADKLRSTPLEQVQRGMQTFLSDLPQPSQYRGPLASQWSPAPRGLPSNVPGNAPYGAPSEAGGGTGPASAAVVTPVQPQALRLPAQAGQDGVGIPDAAPSNAPPPLNQATARTNVNAGTPRPFQEPIPQRTINVSPEGQAAIQRPALPSPATHSFDAQKWQQAHPNGNVKAAIAKAQNAGYKIIGATDRPVPTVKPNLTPQEKVLIRPGKGQEASDATMRAYVKQAGGDQAAARRALVKDGWRRK